MANAALWENPAWLEIILKKHEADSKISKIINLDYKKATAAGDNYTSNMLRVTMTSILGDGKPVKGTIIVKKALENLKDETLGLVSTVFRSEAQIYNYILKKYDELIRGTVLHGSSLWPKCYHASLHGVVMEDLKALHYGLADRKAGLSLPFARLTMTSLGQIHAFSIAAIKKGFISPDILGRYALLNSSSKSFLANTMEAFSMAIQNSWGPEWKTANEKVNILKYTVQDKMAEVYDSNETPLKVICHGDCWVNNQMFKCDTNGIPVSLKFVDFQISHYGSYAWDLNYFMYSSLRPNVRDDNYHSLLGDYSSAFSETLQVLGLDPALAPDVEAVIKELQRVSLMAFLSSALVLPIIISESEDVLSIDDLLGDPKKSEQIFTKPAFRKIMEPLLKKFIDDGTI